MEEVKESLFITADGISKELGISKPHAYKLIKELNKQLKEEQPNAIVIAGRVNRIWYRNALLLNEDYKQYINK